MSDVLLHTGTDLLALVLIAATGVAAFGALAARSLFAMCIGVAVAAALGACAMLALGDGDGGLTFALAGVGVVPVLLLAGLLLSARRAKARGLPLVSLVIAGASVLAIAWISPELQRAPAAATPATSSPALWIALLVFVAITACAGLLGFGERGVLDPDRDGHP